MRSVTPRRGRNPGAPQDALQAEEPEKAVEAVKAVKLAEARAEVDSARLINDLRSGTRGNNARQRLLDLEARFVPSDHRHTCGDRV